MKVIGKLVAVLALAGFAAGCTSIDEVSKMEPKGGAYEKALYSGYMKLAKGEAEEDDFADAELFAQRAKAAAMGKPTEPEQLSERRLKGKYAKELGPARVRLWNALDQGAAKKAGKHVGNAQVAFECWMQEAEEDIRRQRREITKCKSDFYGAMALVEAALWKPKPVVEKKKGPPRTKHFIVFFDFAKSDLSKSGADVVKKAAAFAKQNKTNNIAVTGHTDKVGSQAANKKLSKARVASVLNALKGAGIDTKKVIPVSLGELDPAVNTGGKEARNRRVVIDVTY